MAHAGNGEVGSVGGPLVNFVSGCEAAGLGTRLEQLEKLSTTMVALENQAFALIEKRYANMSDDEARSVGIALSENNSKYEKCFRVRNELIGTN